MMLNGEFRNLESTTFYFLGGLLSISVGFGVLPLAVLNLYFVFTNQTTLEFGYIKSENIFNVGKR